MSASENRNNSSARPEHTGASWSPEEDRQLYLETRQGLSVEAVAHVHGRTAGAIRARQLRLGLRDEHSRQLIEPLPDFRPVPGRKISGHRRGDTAEAPAPLPFKPTEDRKTRRWSLEEDRLLYDETARRQDVSTIAADHGRTERAIRARQARLGLRKNRGEALFDPLPEYKPVQKRDPRRNRRIPEPQPPAAAAAQASDSARVRERASEPSPLVPRDKDALPDGFTIHDEPLDLLWAAIRTDIETLTRSDGTPVFKPRHKAVMLSRLSPGNTLHPFRTLKYIGEELGITGERVRQLESKGLRKLLHPAHASTSRLSTTLRLLADAHCQDDLADQTRWLLEEILATRSESQFQQYVLKVFFKLTLVPREQRNAILAALPGFPRQAQREERRAARSEAAQKKREGRQRQADAFVLGILGKAVYGGSRLAMFPDLEGFAPLRECQGHRKAFSRTLQRAVQVESQGEARVVRALDNCGIINAFAEQAIEIPYKIDGSQRVYIPDLLVRTVEGFAYVIEVKARLRLADCAVQYKARAAEDYLGARGIGYCLVDTDGASVEDLRNMIVSDDLRLFMWDRVSRVGILRLSDLRDYLGTWPGEDIFDQLQAFVLQEGLNYRTHFFPFERSPTGYRFDFVLTAPGQG